MSTAPDPVPTASPAPPPSYPQGLREALKADERAPSHRLRCSSRTSWTALAMACSVACSSHAPAAPSAPVPTQIVSVEGLVTDVLDQPVGRATVTVEGDPNVSAVTVTDDQGKFAASVAVTADASVTARVSAEGFEPAVHQFGIGPHPTALVRTWVGLSALSPLDYLEPTAWLSAPTARAQTFPMWFARACTVLPSTRLRRLATASSWS